jgi:sugar (pentulose or hexulose) kinase
MMALGVDIGSSSIKGAVLVLDTSTVRTPVSRSFPAPVRGLPAGWIEIDPLEVCRVATDVLSILCEQAPDAEWICLSGQMGGLVLLDERAKPLTNYISWRDQRTLEPTDSNGSFLDRIRERWEAAGYLIELGNELQPGSTSALLAWQQAHRQLPPGAIPATIADYVIAHLVGHPIPMHATHAIGMLDLTRDDWHRPAFELLGVHESALPSLSRLETCVGEAHIAGRKRKVFGSYGDQQCALRGAGLQRGELSLNVSTGSQVSRRAEQFHPGPYQSRKYFFGETLDTVTHLPAGRSLNVLIDLLTELARAQGVTLPNPWDTVNRLVAEVDETDLQVNLAFFQGPLGSHGLIDFISLENLTVGTLFHAAFRSMADNYVRIAERFSPASWSSVVLSGGLTQRLPRFRSLLDARFAVPLRESTVEETLAGLLDIAQALRRDIKS